nr:unnamed protein product [Callosobruchus chinensis]
MSNPQLQRHPPLKTAYELHENNFDINERCREKWEREVAPMNHAMPCITNRPIGFDLSLRSWTSLNRTRIKCGRCVDSLQRLAIRYVVQDCSYTGNPDDLLMAAQEAIDYISRLDNHLFVNN